MAEENFASQPDLEHSEKKTGPGVDEPTLDPKETFVSAAGVISRKFIGPYALVRILGEGGMGQVWLAEQTAPVKRPVALKLIKGGLYDSALIQRFAAERQSLAVMNHPAIAKVFDAGSTADGQPYFAMEYVDGPPITRYCDDKKLKIRERLELFIKVCEGVQHAHQKAVIHRDLKPSNILVAEVDGKPLPRIIDFGLAKAISPQPNPEQTQFTQMGAVLGTRGFMSPEQADPSVLDVDTRTDVYSLGVVLYVLLTGLLPFDTAAEKKKPIDELLRQLREEDPPSPSSKVNTEKNSSADAAERRGTETHQLVNSLQGDLDWITLKAVEKDRARRYGTPSELAADIERFLDNRPVVARPASAAYRLKKYVQRHRVGVAAALGAIILFVAFGITQAIQLRRTTRERDRANRITDFMTNMFKVSDPSESRGNNITAREILDKASKEIDSSLTTDPELQAQMMDVMGTVYHSLGLYTKAQPLLERAAGIRKSVLGAKNPATLKSHEDLANLLSDAGHYPEAEKIERENLEMRRRVLGPQHPDTLQSMNDLSVILEDEGHFPEAEKLTRETLDLRRRVLGPAHLDTLTSKYNLGMILWREARYAEAEKLDRETLDARRRILGPDDPQTVSSMGNLALDLRGARKYAEEEALERQVLEIRRRIFGPDHPQTLGTIMNLAVALRLQGKFAEAEQLTRDSLEIRRRVLGPEHPTTVGTMNNLAIILMQEGHGAEAESLYRETLAIQERVLGPEHPDTLRSMGNLAIQLTREGKFADAEKLNRETLAIQRRVLGPEHTNTVATMDNLLNCLADQSKFADAEKLVRQILDIKKRIFGSEDPSTSDARYALACILAVEGNREESLSFLREAVDHGLRPASLQAMESSPPLKSLHGDPRFTAIVADAKQRAAAAQKPN
jgi:eukaryotic-like serine/threonine-protein kinase